MKVVPLGRVPAGGANRFGGKAVALGRLVRAGFAVPDGFALDLGWAARHAAQGLGDGRWWASAAAAAAALGPVVAVRSSGVHEDSAARSLAGLYESVVGVSTADAAAFGEALAQVWRSGQGERALALGCAGPIGVVVQALAPVAAAGVCFSIDPVSGARHEVLIEGAFGLGEAVVAGAVVPERVRVRRPRWAPLGVLPRAFAVSARDTPSQPWELRPEGRVPLPGARQRAVRVDDAAARRIARAALRAEAVFGSPQDLEWALGPDGGLAILQSRPISTAAAVVRAGPVLWTRRFLGERWTEPASPLGWSLIRDLLDWFIAYPATNRALLGGGPATRLVRCAPYVNATVFRHLAFKVPGRAPPRFLLELLPPAEQRAWAARSGALPDVRVYRSILAETAAERRWERFRWNPWTNADHWDAFAAGLPPRVQALSRAPAGTAAEVLAAHARWKALVREYVQIHVCSLLFANLWSEVAEALAARLGVESALAEALRPDARSPTVQMHADLWRLGRGMIGLEAFLAAWGHRAPSSWELFSPRWAEDPAPALRVAAVIAEGEDPSLLAAAAESAGERARAALPSALGPAVRLARRYLRLREDQRHGFDRIAHGWKGLLVGVERRHGVPVRFLEDAELGALLEGRLGAGDAARLVGAREAVWTAERARWARGDEPPAFLVGDEALAAAEPRARLRGIGVSAGTATGPARVLRRLDDAAALRPGEILVLRAADPAWTPLFVRAAGVVLEMGGMLSHAAVVARELGRPCVSQIDGATQRFTDGQSLTVDGRQGLVWAV